jgi:hypothetical protein
MTSGDEKNYEDNSDAEQGERIDGVHSFVLYLVLVFDNAGLTRSCLFLSFSGLTGECALFLDQSYCRKNTSQNNGNL